MSAHLCVAVSLLARSMIQISLDSSCVYRCKDLEMFEKSASSEFNVCNHKFLYHFTHSNWRPLQEVSISMFIRICWRSCKWNMVCGNTNVQCWCANCWLLHVSFVTDTCTGQGWRKAESAALSFGYAKLHFWTVSKVGCSFTLPFAVHNAYIYFQCAASNIERCMMIITKLYVLSS
jgi:hypothetical protein